MKVSVLIPTYERQDLLRRCLDALAESQPPEGVGQEVLVHCQGRDDGSALYAEHRGCRVVVSPEPVSFAKANNALAKLACPESDWFLLLNNDCFLRPGFWQALGEMAGLGFDLVGAKLLYGPGPQEGKIQHFGKWFTLDWVPFHVDRFQPADSEWASQIRQVPDVTFACCAIKRVVWETLGGLDEEFTNGYEDDDFNLRARERCAQIGVHPAMVATHLESQTTGLDNANKQAQMALFDRKWVETGRIRGAIGVLDTWGRQ